jgi:hypothetical protein
MTAAEILRSALPPNDDGVIEKAIAELDVKIWEWTDALKSAHTQLRTAFAVRPAKPSAVLYEGVTPSPALSPALSPSLSEAAAAAHIPTLPTPPQWAAPPPPEASESSWNPSLPSSGGAPPSFAPPPPAFEPSAPASSFQPSAFSPTPSPSSPEHSGGEWPQAPAARSTFGGHGIQNDPTPAPGSMAWPNSPQSVSWPESPSSSGGAQQWPTWTPTDASASAPQKKSSVRASRAPKSVRQSLPEGPTPEERAQKAAAEEALLGGLEDAIARRVRLLRRLDPDTPIEKLIEKARQGHAEAQVASASAPKDDKSSWWRRK